MTSYGLNLAMKECGQTFDDITSIYSLKKGLVELTDEMPDDAFVFTDNFTYIVVQYDGSNWFEGVPNNLVAAKTIEFYGNYGG